MRLAYVCADPGVPVHGRKGCSVHVQELVRAWVAAGWQVELFAASIGGEVPPGLADVRVHHLPHAPRHLPIAAREAAALEANGVVRDWLRTCGPLDLVYERHALWSYAGMECARSLGVPGLLEVNAPLVEEQRTYRDLADEAAANEARRRAFTAASALLPVSRSLADWLAGLGVARERVHVIPNAVDPARFPAGLRPAMPAPGQFTVGFVGTLKPWHGLERLVEAFARLRARHEASRLLIVGDGPERASVASLAAALGVADRIVFTGAVAPAAVPGLLASMDAAVAPYPPQDGFYFSPLKLFEYMAAGVAVVASDIGQVREILTHGTTGLLVPPGNAASLADALWLLAADAGLRRTLATAARETVRAEHTWRGTVARLETIAGLTAEVPRGAAAAD